MAVTQKQAEASKKGSEAFSVLAKREERLAYWLLVPTIVILILIAFYPLGSVFYTSLTNKKFASAEESRFIGLQNYTYLLGFSINRLDPIVDEDTGQPRLDADGSVVYERPIDVLPRTPTRYREMGQFSILGQRFVIGASNRDFMTAIWDTLRFSFFSVVIETILGLGIALVVNSNFKGRGAMRAVMLIPWAIPTAISSRIWQGMFFSTRRGFFNTFFDWLNLGDGSIPFLQQADWQIPVMVAIDVWKTTPFMALLLLAGLQLIPGELYEAANVDGASKIRQFFAITLPLLRPTLAVALIFRTLDALRVFDLFQIVLAQSRYSMASFSYYQLVNNREMGISSAASVVIFFMILIFAVIYIRLLKVDTD
jgi:trehalose/maltose transport system permease protein